ncbi:hypothetical protein [Virgibacillus kimchii]
MNNYNIKCFVVEPSEKLKNTIVKLVSDYTFMVDKGWENGYHLQLRGALDDETLPIVVNELEEGVSDSVINYDENEFTQKYKSTAKILRRSDPFNPIYKGKVTVNVEESIFEKNIEDELFRETNHIFDSYYCRSYFNKNSLYPVIEEVMRFHKMLEVYESPESTEESAYNCHLSHYIAFIHRLNKQDKESIEKQFQLKYESDLNNGLLDFNLSPTDLTEKLINFFHKIRPLVKNKELNFYMPFKRKHIDEKMKHASKRHKVTFTEENMNRYFLYDEVLIANRWIMNALYKKLLLLGLSNTDRFYMNYVVSRLTYPEYALHDYAVKL